MLGTDAWKPMRGTSTTLGSMHPREILEIPRYGDDPVFFFVEQLVIDVIEGIPQEMQEWIAGILKTDAQNWRAKIKGMSNLSATFEIAVLDLWYRNVEILARRGELLKASDFAQLFADNYFAQGSQIDVWGPGALEDAKIRIAAAKSREAGQKA